MLPLAHSAMLITHGVVIDKGVAHGPRRPTKGGEDAFSPVLRRVFNRAEHAEPDEAKLADQSHGHCPTAPAKILRLPGCTLNMLIKEPGCPSTVTPGGLLMPSLPEFSFLIIDSYLPSTLFALVSIFFLSAALSLPWCSI